MSCFFSSFSCFWLCLKISSDSDLGSEISCVFVRIVGFFLIPFVYAKEID